MASRLGHRPVPRGCAPDAGNRVIGRRADQFRRKWTHVARRHCGNRSATPLHLPTSPMSSFDLNLAWEATRQARLVRGEGPVQDSLASRRGHLGTICRDYLETWIGCPMMRRPRLRLALHGQAQVPLARLCLEPMLAIAQSVR